MEKNAKNASTSNEREVLNPKKKKGREAPPAEQTASVLFALQENGEIEACDRPSLGTRGLPCTIGSLVCSGPGASPLWGPSGPFGTQLEAQREACFWEIRANSGLVQGGLLHELEQ